MYLVDTNVWLEPLLEQEHSEEAVNFLRGLPAREMFMTDFSFHSIALVLTRLNEFEGLLRFVQDALVSGKVRLIRLGPRETVEIIETMHRFRLDFDDAYQYVAAKKYELTLVSFDADFDRTERGRKTPGEVLSALE